MTPIKFRCPECRGHVVQRTHDVLVCQNGHSFTVHRGVYCLLPKSVHVLTLHEADYHAKQSKTWVEQNQLEAIRNIHFHEAFIKSMIAKSGPCPRVLEIGGGIGFDLGIFLKLQPEVEQYVFSDVSQDLVADVASRLNSTIVTYCTADALSLPFDDCQFDCVFIVAALHHLPDCDASIKEMMRVTKMGGVIGFGIEPNFWWLRLASLLRGLLRPALPEKDHSPADDEATGFAAADFQDIAHRYNLNLVEAHPVWFLCGVAHYGIELLYRLLRLKKRLVLPASLESVLVRIDLFAARLPGLKGLSWHYSVLYERR